MPDTQDNRRQPVSGLWLLLVLGIAALGGILLLGWRSAGSGVPPGIDAADYERAQEIFRRRYNVAPRPVDTLSLLAEMAVQEGDLETALRCFQQIPTEDPAYGLSARLQAGQVLVRLNRAPQAETRFREFLNHAGGTLPANSPLIASARSWLCFLLSVQMRLEEREPILMQLHETGAATIHESKQLFFPRLLIWNSTTGRERLQKFLRETPDDPELNIAHGRYLTGQGKLTEARRHLEEWANRTGDDPSCLAALLECHFESNDWTAFEQALQRTSSPSDRDPWLLTLMRGRHALHHQRWEQAAGYFERLLAGDPASTSACQGLAEAYAQLGRSQEATELRDRMLMLASIRPKLSNINRRNPDAVDELSDHCEQLGMTEAARTFRGHADRFRADSSSPASPMSQPL